MHDARLKTRTDGDMCWIPAATFRMGSDEHYPEEAPAHFVTVDGFWMDRFTVTNREFDRFVRSDGLRHARRAPRRFGALPGCAARATRALVCRFRQNGGSCRPAQRL